MKVSDFNYTLPDNLIAKHPPTTRGKSRLLVLNRRSGNMQHKRYEDFLDYVNPGDLVVLNDTKVIKARLIATNSKGQRRELLLLEDHHNPNPNKRKVLHKGAVSVQELLLIGDVKLHIDSLLGNGMAEISSTANLLDLADKKGKVPLPPYMHRDATDEDTQRYQTVFAKKLGSVAAPTASLNFTKNLEQKIIDKGAKISYLTLHVGLGTFLPIRTKDIQQHQMHSEYFEIPKETVSAIQQAQRVIAVGTTVARTLEYAAPQILKNKDLQKTPTNISGEADIFIYPGYDFEVIDGLLTNFHAPKSTVLMLATAFAGWDNLISAYNQAIDNNYSFLSYGDSMFIC